MTKTTVYLPADLKTAPASIARERGRSEVALLREAVTRLTAEAAAPSEVAGVPGNGSVDR